MFIYKIWDRQTDKQTDSTVYRVAPQLKTQSVTSSSLIYVLSFVWNNFEVNEKIVFLFSLEVWQIRIELNLPQTKS